MSEVVSLYVVNDDLFPAADEVDLLDAGLTARVQRIVREQGALWDSLETGIADLSDALELIDGFVGGTGAIPMFALSNSPNQLLHRRSAAMGYFPPEVVGDTDKLLSKIRQVHELSEDGIFEDEGTERVFYALADTLAEAASRGHAVAVLW